MSTSNKTTATVPRATSRGVTGSGDTASVAEAPGVDNSKNDDDGGVTIDTPFGIPQTHTYERDKIFVRECYPEYYEKLLTQMLETHYITVTGTPGIGKSIFYLYFFERYRQENRDKKVVTVAFDHGQNVMESLLWNSLDEIKAGEAEHIDLEKNVPTRLECLHLYDGPPKHQPQRPRKGYPNGAAMIAFSSPSEGWLKHARKIEAHRQVFMPNWTYVELTMANDVLDLGLTEEIIKNRMALFGSTARYVITKDDVFVKTGREDLENELSGIKSITDVKACFDRQMDLRKIVHRLLHYAVREDDWTTADLKPASKVVAAMIHGCLNCKLDDDRKILMQWLDGAGKASTFNGWLFENFVHERLLGGGEFPMAGLGDAGQEESDDLSMPAMAESHYKRFKLEVSLEEVLIGSYRMPDASNLQSVDSYIQIDGVTWMFQITRNIYHEVDLEGIINILKYVGSFDGVINDVNLARLVFVVPMQMKDEYRKQKLIRPSGLSGSQAEIMAAPCDNISGIGRERKRKLSELQNIRTVGELLAADEATVKFVRGAVAKFRAQMETLDYLEILKKIPQYVIGTDYSEEK